MLLHFTVDLFILYRICGRFVFNLRSLLLGLHWFGEWSVELQPLVQRKSKHFEMIKQTNINKCICAPTHMHNLLHLWRTLFYSKYFSLWVSPCLWKCAWPVFLHAAGNFHWTVEDVAKSIVCMMMSGPCLTGYTQVLSLSFSLKHKFVFFHLEWQLLDSMLNYVLFSL